MIDIFWDDENGLFFLAKEDSKDLIVRQKNLLDGAIPQEIQQHFFFIKAVNVSGR